MRRNICKICRKKKVGQYYEINPMGKLVWLCDDDANNVKYEEITIKPLIK